MVNGVLNVDKPAGITSHDVVDRVRRAAGQQKVGHAGTLDPFATGVLVIALGRATRLLQYTGGLSKTYEATFTLGAVSDTDDATGVITPASSSAVSVPDAGRARPAEAQIRSILESFIGEIEQIPPAYAAVKYKGKKLYELARAGGGQASEAARKRVRRVRIFDIELLGYEYPALRLRIRTGSGAYIRALARDVGAELGTGAYVEELRRTAVGSFPIEKAVSLNAIETDGVESHFLPPALLISHLPSVTVSTDTAARLCHGQRVDAPAELSPDQLLAVFDEREELIAVEVIIEDGTSIKPQTVL